ncbi:hypothetical protein FNO01nite_15440 [Flavobacterium noncentrifugens]|uniref:Uncharacterized protein n=1 Tax=Flavobacterium noncentrifugens TaxID=1128970 RepID=A0A1G8WD51_9FLAO|nr:carboxypeptidase-like regulatory domain-containing protein [Flavobacterium noncentrifugens]GEP50872.1 hypothetical protein FNO01nite_15440 [Flavobacterium noncentrifugens]SDJ76141.1 hypothetical protein SAMN04487935_1761 [Flavobacterium noncentrifugens]
MKKILLFFILLAAVSCETIEYDGQTRLVIEGKVVDKNQNPIPETTVRIVAYNSAIYEKTEDLISFGTTDASGNFQLIIPAPKENGQFLSVQINTPENQNQQKFYNSILRKNFTDYKLRLDPVVLYPYGELTRLTVLTNQLNSSKAISDIRITAGIQSEDYFEFNPSPEDFISNEFYFRVLKNQMISVNYKVTDYSSGNAPVVNEYVDSFMVNSDDIVNHTINY